MTIHEQIPMSARRALPAVAVVAAVLFTVQTVVQVVVPQQSEPFARATDYLIEAVFLAGLLAITVAVPIFHRWHSTTPGWGRVGAVAAVVAALGTGLLSVTVAATALAGRDVLGVLFLAGLPLWAIGGILLGIAAFRARRLPRPVAVFLGAAVPLATVIDEPAGPIVVAALWATIAWCARR